MGILYFFFSRIDLIARPDPPGVPKKACDEIQHFISSWRLIFNPIFEPISLHLTILIPKIGMIKNMQDKNVGLRLFSNKSRLMSWFIKPKNV